jgi:DNA replication protein DnaC
VRAKIPEIFRIETYPFEKQPRLNKRQLLAVYDAFEFVEKRQNLIWLGPTGVGKTGLATSFLMNAIEHGHTGRYVVFRDLLSELYRSVADHSEDKTLARYAAWDCLLVDEIGYAEPEPTRVGLFFTLMQRRHRKRPTLVTSNLGFDDWRSFFKNDQLTAALVDKLTEMSHVFNMRNCKSLRAKLPEDS